MTLKQRKNILRRFEEIRGDRSYKQFAKDSGITMSLLHRYETGAGLPSSESLVALAEKERISIEWLLLGEGSMNR